jgi:hypothetical protein
VELWVAKTATLKAHVSEVLVVVVEMAQSKVVVVPGTGVVVAMIMMKHLVHLVAPVEVMEIINFLGPRLRCRRRMVQS